MRDQKINRRDVLGLAVAAAASTAAMPAFAAESASKTKSVPAQSVAAGVPEVTAVITTTSGRVQGLVRDRVHSFRGVRYGAAPVGDLRWMPPQKPEPWSIILDCSEYGAPAMQMASGATAAPMTDFGMQMSQVFTTPSEMKIQNEDCLFLNVWTPATDDKKRAVVFWIHGGGFAYGSGGQPIYSGEDLARAQDIVVVSVNHRLNAFGYLYLGDLMGDAYKNSGTVGMQDLVLALEWVRDNIAKFGGDSGSVLIAGQSGGGVKVCDLLAMPSAKGLFQRASIQSGASPVTGRKEMATRVAKAVLDELKIAPGDIKSLQGVPAQTIIKATGAAMAKMGGGGFGGPSLGPIIDDALPRDPFAPDAPDVSAEVPILVGFVKDEMTIFMASEPWFGKLTDAELEQRAKLMPKGPELLATLRKIYPTYTPTYLMTALMSARFGQGSYTVAERKAAKGKAPVYMWFLTWETPVQNGLFKTPHTMEIPFMLHSYNQVRAYVGPGKGPDEMAKQFSDAWVAFARTGKPDAPSIPHWPAYDATTRATMVFNLPSKVVNDPNAEIRKILENQS
jgi:para-nitrobenzyl esterase